MIPVRSMRGVIPAFAVCLFGLNLAGRGTNAPGPFRRIEGAA